jgi:ribosomal-protein-alanine N-acetyltransferase
MNFKRLENGFNIYLDEETEQDAYTLHKWFIEGEPERMSCRPIEVYDIDELLRRFHKKKQSGYIQTFAVRRVEDNELLGRVTYFDINHRNGSVEIGFMLASKYHQKGYATEALILLLKHIFDDLGLRKVMAQTAEFNNASIALLKKIGFKQDGCLRQHHELDGKYFNDLLFSMLRGEFTFE